MKNKVLLGIGLSVSLLLSGCVTTDVTESIGDIEETMSEETMSEETMSEETMSEETMSEEFKEEFSTDNDVLSSSLQLLEFVEENSEGNKLVSPYSLNNCLYMLLLGTSDEEEKAKLCDYLGLDINKDIYTQVSMLMGGQDGEVVAQVNGVWINDLIFSLDKFKIKEEYIKELESVKIGLERYKDKNIALESINKFSDTNTEGLIPTILETPEQVGDLTFINALYFKDTWLNGYSEYDTSKEVFNNKSGSKPIVKYMTSEEDFYYRVGNTVGYEKEYASGNYIFRIAMTEGSDDTAITREKLSELFTQSAKTSTEGKLYTHMPSFKVENKSSLLGLPILQDYMVDSSLLGNITEAPLLLSEALQKTVMEVNEDGTEAAAVTDVSVNFTSVRIDEPVETHIKFDRPFIYQIIHNKTGQILFMGEMNNMVAVE